MCIVVRRAIARSSYRAPKAHNPKVQFKVRKMPLWTPKRHDPKSSFGPYPHSTAGTFRKKFRKNSGKTPPETLSERFLEFPSRVRLGCPKPYNSRHLRLPERFQNSLPPSTAGDASFFRIGSGGSLSELVMEFPAVLGVFLIIRMSINGILIDFGAIFWRSLERGFRASGAP